MPNKKRRNSKQLELVDSAATRKIAAESLSTPSSLTSKTSGLELFKGADDAIHAACLVVQKCHVYRLKLLHSDDPIGYVRPFAFLINTLETHAAKAFLILHETVAIVPDVANSVLRRCHQNQALKTDTPTRRIVETEIFDCTENLREFLEVTIELWRMMKYLGPFVDVYRFRLDVRNYIRVLIVPLQDLVHRILKKLQPVFRNWKDQGSFEAPWNEDLIGRSDDGTWSLKPFDFDIGWPLEDETLWWEVQEPTWTGGVTLFGYGDEMVVEGRGTDKQFPWVRDSPSVIMDTFSEDPDKLRPFFNRVIAGEAESSLSQHECTDASYSLAELPRRNNQVDGTIRHTAEEAAVEVKHAAGVTMSIDGTNPFLISLERPIVTSPRTSAVSLAYPLELHLEEGVIDLEDLNKCDEEEVEEELVEEEVKRKGRTQGGLLEFMFWDILFYTREPPVLDQILSIVGSNIFRQAGRSFGDVLDGVLSIDATGFFNHFKLYYRASAQERLLLDFEHLSSYSYSQLLQSTVDAYRNLLRKGIAERPVEDFRGRLIEHECRRMDHGYLSKAEVFKRLNHLIHSIARLSMSDFRSIRFLTNCVYEQGIEDNLLSIFKQRTSDLSRELTEFLNVAATERQTTEELQQDYRNHEALVRYLNQSKEPRPSVPQERGELERAYRRHKLERYIFKSQLYEQGYGSETEFMIDFEVQKRVDGNLRLRAQPQQRQQLNKEDNLDEMQSYEIHSTGRRVNQNWIDLEEVDENRNRHSKEDDGLSSSSLSEVSPSSFSDVSSNSFSDVSSDLSEVSSSSVSDAASNLLDVSSSSFPLKELVTPARKESKTLGLECSYRRGRRYWRARWNTHGKGYSSNYFYVDVLGEDGAKAKAVAVRHEKEETGIATIKPESNTGIKHVYECTTYYQVCKRVNGARRFVTFSKKKFGNEKARQLAVLCASYLKSHKEQLLSREGRETFNASIIERYEQQCVTATNPSFSSTSSSTN